MKILLDCDVLVSGKISGVEMYTTKLLTYLDPSIGALYNKDVSHPLLKLRKSQVTDWNRAFNSKFMHAFFTPPQIRTDLIHCTIPVLPFWSKPKGLKLVVTVHDIIPKLFPKAQTFRRNLYFKFIFPHVLAQADRIISVSQSTKKDLVKHYGIDESTINVTYLGSDLTYTKATVPKKYNLPKDYILFVGTVEPRKNLRRVIEAYKKLNPKESLVIVGAKGWEKEDIYQNSSKKIIFTGYVDSEDLPKIYSNAKVFIYPSLYEGFGIPVLEAMNCRVPVITSHVSSLPEVAGDAAIYVDPYSINDMKDAMAALLKSKKLRDEFIKKGIQQSKKFSWKKTARQTEQVYNSFLN